MDAIEADEVYQNKIADLRAQLDQARTLAERLRQEAQIHAMEARGANASLAECYRAATGGKGEPGNWHGAKPVVELIARQRAWIERRGHKKSCEALRCHECVIRTPKKHHDDGFLHDFKPGPCDCGYSELTEN